MTKRHAAPSSAPPEPPPPSRRKNHARAAQEEADRRRRAEIQAAALEGTAGPWVVETIPTHHPDLFLYHVLAPQGWQEPNGEYKVCTVTSDLDNLADAHAIAAVPVMLATLQMIAEQGSGQVAELAGQALAAARVPEERGDR